MQGSTSLNEGLLNPETTTATPADVQGQAAQMMAGLRNSQLGSTLQTIRARMRPWVTDFASPTQFTAPGDQLATRVRTNLTYYKSNYACLFGASAMASIVTNPSLLVSIIILAVGWGFLLFHRPRLEDGSLMPITVATRTLNGFEQKAALSIMTLLLMLLTGLTGTIFFSLGLSVFVVGSHAALHRTDLHEIDSSDFGGGQFTVVEQAA
ncbi:PRA1 family protein-domain-containing protein [Baffinella frigidus]|nr:PRA1 family protein-domain-containing protein [Cryptophyta sp. CCMP2293]